MGFLHKKLIWSIGWTLRQQIKIMQQHECMYVYIYIELLPYSWL
jgi:hypothetical protein